MTINDAVEAGAAGMYGKKWNSPKDEERPGEKMKDVWRKYSRDCIAAAYPELVAEIERLRKALEPFAAADRAIGNEPGPFRFETMTGYRVIEREDFRRARAILDAPKGDANG